jgi:uncharacterized protein (TIGR02246 family)
MSRQTIEAQEQAFLQAFNGGDAAEVTRFYGDGARILPPNADAIQGSDAIEAFFKEFVALRTQLSFNLLTVHESPDVCTAVGEFEMAMHPEGADPQQNRGKYIEVWRRQSDGSWRIVDDIFNSSLPA